MTMQRISHALIAVTLAAASVAHADIFEFRAEISGSQENPPVNTPATGMLTGFYDDIANTFSFSWNITDNLVGNPASPGAHIHMAPAGSNGPIVFDFANSDGTWPLVGSAVWSGISTTHVDALFAGNLYVNFHTDAFAPGEVRGQIGLIPSPASLALLGAAGILSARRRRI